MQTGASRIAHYQARDDIFRARFSVWTDRVLYRVPMLWASPDDLFAYLDSLGIAHRTVTHAPVFTVEESRGLMSRVPGVHSKNLFLRDKKGTLFLIVASEDAAIELKSLHQIGRAHV